MSLRASALWKPSFTVSDPSGLALFVLLTPSLSISTHSPLRMDSINFFTVRTTSFRPLNHEHTTIHTCLTICLVLVVDQDNRLSLFPKSLDIISLFAYQRTANSLTTLSSNYILLSCLAPPVANPPATFRCSCPSCIIFPCRRTDYPSARLVDALRIKR